MDTSIKIKKETLKRFKGFKKKYAQKDLTYDTIINILMNFALSGSRFFPADNTETKEAKK